MRNCLIIWESKVSVINLDKDTVLASNNIEEVKKAYELLLRDKDRFERWSNDAQDKIQDLETELLEVRAYYE